MGDEPLRSSPSQSVTYRLNDTAPREAYRRGAACRSSSSVHQDLCSQQVRSPAQLQYRLTSASLFSPGRPAHPHGWLAGRGEMGTQSTAFPRTKDHSTHWLGPLWGCQDSICPGGAGVAPQEAKQPSHQPQYLVNLLVSLFADDLLQHFSISLNKPGRQAQDHEA